MAAAGLGSRALATLWTGIGHDRNRLAVRVVSRLVAIVVLSRAAADAGFGKCGSRKGDRWLASGHGMDAAGGDRHPRRDGDGPHFDLPRPHHAADAAGIAIVRQQPSKSEWKAVLRAASELSIIRQDKKRHGENALAKSQWSFKTAVELSKALAARQVSAVELAQDAIGRIERHDAKINAICVRDFERGLDAARAADAALARGETRPLLGIPLTVKESYNVAGLPTTWGFPAQKDFTPPEDALAISRVKAAGGVILGKTNVPVGLADWQSYNEIYSITNKPLDLRPTPRPSSR